MQQIVLEKPQGYENLNYAENQYDIETQIKDMDDAGVATGILRIPCWQEWLTLDMCRQVNDKLYEHINRYPGRFSTLAVVPPWGTPECLKEAERCLGQLGFSGVQLAVHYGRLYLDEPEFRPYFRELDKLDVPVVVHHTPLPVDYASLLKYTNQRRQYGRCVDQATGVGREIFSDLFEECPNLKLIHTMLGGGFFAYANMLAPRSRKCQGRAGALRQRRHGEDSPRKEHLLRHLRRHAVGQGQLECAVRLRGGSHLVRKLLPGQARVVRDGHRFVRGLEISDETRPSYWAEMLRDSSGSGGKPMAGDEAPVPTSTSCCGYSSPRTGTPS